jgi:hypothetical protein
MKKAWRDLRNDRRVSIAINLGTLGICIAGKATARKNRRVRLIATV